MVRLDQVEMFGDRILVDPDEKHDTSEGGLHIPPSVLRDNPNYYNMTGIVVRLGDGVMRHTFQCLNCNALSPQDEGSCPGCHQPLGNKNTRVFEASDERYAFDVQVGDRVLFNRFAGKQVELEDAAKRFLIMRESEILGIVEGAHRIVPGYKAPKAGKVTDGLTL